MTIKALTDNIGIVSDFYESNALQLYTDCNSLGKAVTDGQTNKRVVVLLPFTPFCFFKRQKNEISPISMLLKLLKKAADCGLSHICH